MIKFIETMMSNFSDVIIVLAQFLALIVIAIGIIKAVFMYIKDIFFKANSSSSNLESRMELGHSFSLGLGFLIGSSIIKTTFAPTWSDIGKLATIVAIRTFLNYFLMKDINDNIKTKIDTIEE